MLVDATAGHELLSFMDAYSGYQQIRMHPDDEEKTAFMTNMGLYCYMFMPFGKFLGYMVTQRGIEANPAQIDSIMKIQSPTCVKDVQKLTGMIAAGVRGGITTTQAIPDQPAPSVLLVYLAVSETTVSAVLVREDEGRQAPIYYVSKSLLDAETRYSQLEKLALALVHTARKLRPYFQCHSISVVTTYPLKAILHKPELSGRLTKWAVELSEYDITFKPQTTLKSQVLSDFIVDFTPNLTMQTDKELCCMTEEPDQTGIWKLYVDGSSNMRGSGLSLVLISPQGDMVEQSVRCQFKATNNEAEYEAMLAGLELAKEIGVKRINVFSDSHLVVNQMQGSYQAKDAKMIAYLGKTKELQLSFEEFTLSQVPRGDNSHADALANLGSSIQTTQPKVIQITCLQWPATQKDKEEQVHEVSAEPTWMTPITDYLAQDTLPDDRNEARRLKAQAVRFSIIRGKLYKRSYNGPYLRCINHAEARYVLSELHEGECGDHSGRRSLAHRTLTSGYYWPTMKADSTDYVKRCDKCQRFAQVFHLPPKPLKAITSPWPFMKWGMDIVGKLHVALGQKVYMLAVTDYFTKWIEADSFHQVRDKEVKGFIWKNVICRYGVPKEIVTDNGSQFISADFQDFCRFWNIKLSFSTPR
ncbi:uncharacterized protein LOC131025645 [Salvia miltiorrhiza]|uniref:uncharacterized protein LOC131025645 n=1 Tax=Salvia miltiorrhiza TaxID=226208 RepID=UPI0025ABE6AE|nr:uncharacterized protein LOC131025645 [Salvia miltiorrhiza]